MKDYPHMPGWRLNKSDNKPAIKHSILMLTTHGVAEGEWDGNEWLQYRWSAKIKDSDVYYWLYLEDLTQLEKEGDSLKQEQPEPYFYCKYGGTIPLCSDCKRNHSNSSFKTEEITTWYVPSNGTKHCVDYIQKEQQMPDSTQLIAEWEKEKAMLEQKDFRGDGERMAYNAFLDGFIKGLGYESTR